jgi:hypothetical protein
MTAIPRELYRHYPGMFDVSVQTPHKDIWLNNPFIRYNFGMDDQIPDAGYEVIKMGYSPRHEADGKHFMQSYLDVAAEKLKHHGVEALPLTEFRPYIRMTEEETAEGPSRHGATQGLPYWLVMVGGKEDISTKWWDPKSWQQVVHTLASDEDFPILVQVGKSGKGARHPLMDRTVNLVDQTSIRDLLWLMYHSRGVICGVTSLMHMAAALRKPCVAIAGGREAWWWDSYDDRAFEKHKDSIPEKYHKLFPLRPRHVYLDSLGSLDCCKEGGCWKLGIGEKQPHENCVDIVKPERYSAFQSIPQPRCMITITPSRVLDAVMSLERGER